MNKNLVRDYVDFIAEEMEAELGKESHLHLASCGGCGCPSFGQPCAVCDYYPMGASDPFHDGKQRTLKDFKKAVAASGPGGTGNIASWYYSDRRKTVAYKEKPEFREAVDRLIEKSLKPEFAARLPAPEDVWAEVVDTGAVIRRAQRAGHFAAWAAIDASQCFRRSVQYDVERGCGWLEPIIEDLRAAEHRVVAALHNNELKQRTHYDPNFTDAVTTEFVDALRRMRDRLEVAHSEGQKARCAHPLDSALRNLDLNLEMYQETQPPKP